VGVERATGERWSLPNASARASSSFDDDGWFVGEWVTAVEMHILRIGLKCRF